MAEEYGAGLLSEVQQVGLDEVLRSLRNRQFTYRRELGIPPIDKFYSQLRQASNEAQTSASLSHSGIIGDFRQHGNPVVEFTGLSPCSGKSSLLYKTAAETLLRQTSLAQGNGGIVVWFDLENRFSIGRLYSILLRLALDAGGSASSPLPEDRVAELVKASFRHLYLFRPQSSSAWLAELESLEKQLLESDAAMSSTAYPLHTLVIGNVSAFYWQDRQNEYSEAAAADHRRLTPGQRPLVQQWRSIVSVLNRIRTTFECFVVATNVALSPARYSGGVPAVQPHLPAAWNNFVTLRVLTRKEEVAKFERSISVEEAFVLAEERQDTAVQPTFFAWIEISEGLRQFIGDIDTLRGCFRFGSSSDRVGIEEGRTGS